jgi:hypothetical protein
LSGTLQSTRAAAADRPLRISLDRVANLMLALLVFSGGYVIVEPSPYEVVFIPTLLIFVLVGFRLRAEQMPLLILLILFNIGGMIALTQVLGTERTTQYVIISVFMAATCVFYAAIFAERTLERFAWLRTGYTLAAMLASATAIMGYFDIAGTQEIFTLYNRAKGTFKDPNVFGPFLILPTVLLLQDVLTARSLRPVRTLMPLGLILIGLFLSFSRAAWAHVILSSLMMVGFLLITSPSPMLRLRVMVITAVTAGVAVVGLAALLTVPEIREVFEVRASLNQDYDVEAGGRFDNQINSLPLLLQAPQGLGPLQFGKIYGDDSHNVYLNAFSAYSWLGGLSYATLILITWIYGLKYLFRPSPYQQPMGAVLATFFVLTLEGFVIDTDHWRHFFLLLGLTWGFIGAVRAHQRHMAYLRTTV